MIAQEIKDALAVFKNISFDPNEHAYHINGKKCVSVTELIGHYKKPFDADKWSKIKAREVGVDQLEILERWDRKREIADVKGKVSHKYMESLLEGTTFCYPKNEIEGTFSGEDPIRDRFEKISKQMFRFVCDIRGKMEPIVSEQIVGDESLLLCGTIDQIFFNNKHDELQIWDWKTNSKIDEDSRYPLLPPIESLTNCHLNVYSLQTSLYKMILEKTTALRFGKSHLVWFNENNDAYRIFKCRDYLREAMLIAGTTSSPTPP
jgi:hypothetical protein